MRADTRLEELLNAYAPINPKRRVVSFKRIVEVDRCGTSGTSGTSASALVGLRLAERRRLGQEFKVISAICSSCNVEGQVKLLYFRQ
jgi:hypothetical protein